MQTLSNNFSSISLTLSQKRIFYFLVHFNFLVTPHSRGPNFCGFRFISSYHHFQETLETSSRHVRNKSPTAAPILMTRRKSRNFAHTANFHHFILPPHPLTIRIANSITRSTYQIQVLNRRRIHSAYIEEMIPSQFQLF